jgi:NADH-quinone oxidoreductase subunit M
VFAAFFVFFAMANSGLPGTSGFVGEFMVIMGTIKVSFWWAFLAATTLIFGAAYTLWMVKRVIFGAIGNDHVAKLADVGKRELAFLVILAVAVLWMGLHPKPFSDVMNPTIQELLRHVMQSKVS